MNDFPATDNIAVLTKLFWFALKVHEVSSESIWLSLLEYDGCISLYFDFFAFCLFPGEMQSESIANTYYS